MLFSFLVILLKVISTFCTIIGGITVIYWLQPPPEGYNHLLNIASWWVGLTQPETLADDVDNTQY